MTCQFLAHEAISIEPLVRAEPLRHRIKLPAAFADRFARTRSIGVDVLARQRLNTNLIKDCRIVLDGHGPAWLADCNSSRFAATAVNLMRNVLICSSRACCSAPGGSMRAVSKSLAAIFSRSCISIPTALRPAEHNRFGEALSVRYQTQRPRRAAAGDTSSLIRTLTIPKRYAAGLEMSCPGGACYWAPEIPSVTVRPSRPGARADMNRFTIVVVFSSARPAVGTVRR